MSAGVKRLVGVVGVVGMPGALFMYGILRDPTKRNDLPSALLNKTTPNFSVPLFKRYHAEYENVFNTTTIASTPLGQR